MAVAIIVVIMMISIISTMVYVVYKQIQKTNPINAGNVIDSRLESAQDFLPIKNVSNGMMYFGGSKYRAIIEVNSINIQLKTSAEQEAIELSLKQLFESIDFNIVFYIQTRLIDPKYMIESLKDDIENTVKEFPHLNKYCNYYLSQMDHLGIYTGSKTQKRKFIIIPYDNEDEIDKLSQKEKDAFVAEKLLRRIQILIEGLAPIGIKAHILSDKEIKELIYASTHKDNFSIEVVEQLNDDGFLTDIVEGIDPTVKVDSLDYIDWVFLDTQNKIKKELLKYSDIENSDSQGFIKELLVDYYNSICDMRDNIGAKYSNNKKISDIESDIKNDGNILDRQVKDNEI